MQGNFSESKQNTSFRGSFFNASLDDRATPASFELYRELMHIAQEIETCRASL